MPYFKPLPKRKLSTKVKGLLISPIQYEVRVANAQWDSLLAPYEPQRYSRWDSSDCWALASVNDYETNLKWLFTNNMFSEEAKSFFLTNNYCNSTGDFTLSERFHEILCGNRDNGGTSEEAWQSFYTRGHIPRSQLMYTIERAESYVSQTDFDNDYFNKNAVTPQMIALGLQFRKYVTSAYQRIGKEFANQDISILRAALKQAPLNLGVPVPVPQMLWNSPVIKYDGGIEMDHEVTCYSINDDGSYNIRDQYQPWLIFQTTKRTSACLETLRIY